MGASSDTYPCSYCWLLTIVRHAKVSKADRCDLFFNGIIVGLMHMRIVDDACKADSEAFRVARVVGVLTVFAGADCVAVKS